MMSRDPSSFFFILDKDKNIADMQNALIEFSQAAADLHHMVMSEWAERRTKEEFTRPSTHKIENIAAYIQEKIKKAQQSAKTELSLSFFFEEDNAIDIGFTIETSYRAMLLYTSNNFFNEDYFLQSSKRVDAFIGFCKLCYRFCSPLYGYGITEITDWSHPESADQIDQLKLTTLYCYNFLGPALAKSYGLNVLKSIPAWQVEELDDGGIFLAMEQIPFYPDRSAHNYEQAIALLKASAYVRFA